MSSILIANTGFVAVVDGRRYTVRKGKTMVPEGHPILVGREHLFDAVEPSRGFELDTPTESPQPSESGRSKRRKRKPAEQATAVPGELRDLTED